MSSKIENTFVSLPCKQRKKSFSSKQCSFLAATYFEHIQIGHYYLNIFKHFRFSLQFLGFLRTPLFPGFHFFCFKPRKEQLMSCMQYSLMHQRNKNSVNPIGVKYICPNTLPNLYCTCSINQRQKCPIRFLLNLGLF